MDFQPSVVFAELYRRAVSFHCVLHFLPYMYLLCCVQIICGVEQ